MYDQNVLFIALTRFTINFKVFSSGKVLRQLWPFGQYDVNILHALLNSMLNFTADTPSSITDLMNIKEDESRDEKKSICSLVLPGSLLSSSSLIHSVCRLLAAGTLPITATCAGMTNSNMKNHQIGGLDLLDGSYVHTYSNSLNTANKIAQKNTTILGFHVLCNLVWSQEARNALVKAKFCNYFEHLKSPKALCKRRPGLLVITLWLELILTLSFTNDGQQFILRIPGFWEAFVPMIESSSGKCRKIVLIILKNLCISSHLKNKILAVPESSGDPEVFLIISSMLRPYDKLKDAQCQWEFEIAVNMIQSLLYTSQKMRHKMRRGCILKALSHLVNDKHVLKNVGSNVIIQTKDCCTEGRNQKGLAISEFQLGNLPRLYDCIKAINETNST